MKTINVKDYNFSSLSFKIKNYFNKHKITKYLDNLKNNNFSINYIESKKENIECLEWIEAYYENRTACTPKELLEEYIHKYKIINSFDKDEVIWIKTLYYWVYYKKITGFY
jgi:hypothetical protein